MPICTETRLPLILSEQNLIGHPLLTDPILPLSAVLLRKNSLMTSQLTVAIVYASIHHSNTRKLAESLSAELSADLFAADDTGQADLTQYDLVGLGSGIYFGRNHSSLLNLVDSWQKPPRRVFIFSTAGLPFLKGLQHAALRRRLKIKGCEVVAEFSCRGWDTVGPLWFIGGINRKHPDSSDLNRATAFARRLKSSVSVS